MATRSRMMDGLCLHLLSGRHSKIINKYAASFFFVFVSFSLSFKMNIKTHKKNFPQQVLDHKLIHEVSMRQAHTCTRSHIQNTHLSRAMRQRFFPPPLLYKAVSMATRSSFWHWRGESYRKYERPPRGGHGYCWRTELESLGFKRKAAVWGQISAECSIQCMVLINSS